MVATIQIKGTNTGVTTDFDGNFSIDANENDILVVSFIGYATQEVTVSGQDDLSITLVSDSELEEIVLTGYGSFRNQLKLSLLVHYLRPMLLTSHLDHLPSPLVLRIQ